MAREVFKLVGRIALEGFGNVAKELGDSVSKAAEFEKTLGKIGRNVSKAGVALSKQFTAPIAAATAAIGLLSIKTADYASKISSLSSATRLSSDTIQELEHVARAAGTSADGMFSVISKLNKKLPELAQGNGRASEALHNLGINVTNVDGSLRSMNDLFPEIINGLQGIDSETERNVIAAEIFGGNIAALAPVLDMSAEEMAKLRKEAHDMGLVMSGEAMQTADDFRVGIENLKATFIAISRDVAVNFMPVFNEQLIPLINDRLVPAIKFTAGVLGGLTEKFSGLPSWVQNTIIVFTAFVAALGPALLITGKLIIALKGVVSTYATAKLAVLAYTTAKSKKTAATAAATVATTADTAATAAQTVAVKTAATAMAAKAVAILAVKTAGAAAILVLAAMIVKTRQLNKETERYNEITEGITNTTNALASEARAAKAAAKEYENLKGTAEYNAEEHKRLIAVHEDAVIALNNHSRAVNNKAAANDEEIESIRRNVKAQHGIIEARKEVEAVERESEFTAANRRRAAEEQSKRAEEQSRRAAEARRREAEAARQAEEQRIKSLVAMAKSHQDAIDNMLMGWEELLEKEERIALEEAERLQATEAEKDLIRRRFEIQYAQRLDEIRERAYNELRAEEERLKESEKQKNKTREEANASWERRLIQQSGDKEAILAAEHATAIAAAKETGADIARIDEYYRLERERLKKEHLDRLATERRRALDMWVNTVVGAVNKIGSIMSGASRNEEMRLAREYKERREHIEANIEDEEERARTLEALKIEEEEKSLDMRRRQAQRDKKLGVFNALIDTAGAIVRALRDPGGIAGGILAGVYGALGAAQTAVIASTPEPFFAGGLIQGSPEGRIIQAGERNQSELVMPLEKGVGILADKLIDRVGTTNNTFSRPININVGTLIADDRGIRDLSRRIRTHLVADDIRTGVLV